MFTVKREKVYKVKIEQNLPAGPTVEKPFLTTEELDTLVIKPYDNGIPFVIDGIIVRPSNITSVKISEKAGIFIGLDRFSGGKIGLYDRNDKDVTTTFINGPPGGMNCLNTPLSEMPPQLAHLFDSLVTNEQLREASRKRFHDGNYTDAVEAAFKCVNNSVKEKLGMHTKDGADLMRTAFSANSPVLFLNTFQSQSDKDEQQGYMDIFAGSMTGIRNPRAHEHGLVDEPEVALELLVLANHLMRKSNASIKKEPETPQP